MSDDLLLEVRGVGKSFPGVIALENVELTLKRGEVLAVVGENGAGKSTLMKILAGVHPHDKGQVLVDGAGVNIASTRAAMRLGIVLIHQELNLSDNLDVASNIFLGREPQKRGLIASRRMHEDAVEFLSRVGLEVLPTTVVSSLSIGQQQLVEIAKALSVDARVLIMDEPTSSLSAAEAEQLFAVVRDLSQRGVSIIYISHRLGEVLELADRVLVLRDGRNAGELAKEEINHDSMVNLMVGRDVSQFYARGTHTAGEPLLEVQSLVTPTWPQHALTFRVNAGEVVGVAGLVGAGRTEMLRVLFGVDRAVSGTIRLCGKQVQLGSPHDAIDVGMALVPEDRKQHGVILELSVRQNIGLAGLYKHRKLAGFVNSQQEKQDAVAAISQMQIRTPSDRQAVQFLSGGNQQKVVISKWLAQRPRLLLMDEPTRGIDVGAKEEIYHLMDSLAREGMGILFVSSELEEIIGLSDRAIVMHEGRISGELGKDELTETAIMQLATATRN